MSILTENWQTWYIGVLISNPDLDFWNSYPKIYFWQNLGPKIQSCLFCLKISALSISRMLIPNPDLAFEILIPKSNFGQNWPKKSKLSVLTENWHTWYLGSAESECGLRVLKLRPQNPFLDKLESKNLNYVLCLQASAQSILTMWL